MGERYQIRDWALECIHAMFDRSRLYHCSGVRAFVRQPRDAMEAWRDRHNAKLIRRFAIKSKGRRSAVIRQRLMTRGGRR